MTMWYSFTSRGCENFVCQFLHTTTQNHYKAKLCIQCYIISNSNRSFGSLSCFMYLASNYG